MTPIEPPPADESLDVAALWKALADAAAAGTDGWRLVRCRTTPGRSLFAALEPGPSRRVLLLPLLGARPPSRSRWPRSAGLDPVSVKISGEPHVGVALKDARFSDVFDALAVDLSRRVERARGSDEALALFIGQLSRWQRFLSAASEGLTAERERGLWGELRCLEQHLIPKLGSTAAVTGWKGPARAHQDFQFASGAIEVKSTTSKQPQSVRITSERQLDDKSWPALFLFVLVLEQHDESGLTLPGLVLIIREKLAGDSAALDLFDDALVSAGYLDAHAARYNATGYTLRSEQWFRVRGAFPRIVERSLPAGVGDASYALSIAACKSFAVSSQTALRSLSP